MRYAIPSAIVLLAVALSAQTVPKPQATELTVGEARILVYLSPPAKAVRKDGFDVGMELQSSTAYNEADYFDFYMYDSNRRCDGCSPTVGYFAVNKHTGDVRDVEAGAQDTLITDEEMAGVQRIVRVEHHITPEVVSSFRNCPVDAR